MSEAGGVHPDEGTIHAWLDGELDADASAGLAAHIADCAECASRVAEARGLIAGATRVAGLLDGAQTPLQRPASTPTAGADLSLWRLLRVTPARAAIAATLVVAIGVTLTRGKLGLESDSRRLLLDSSAESRPAAVAASAPSAPVSEGVLSATPDSVLRSGVERRLAKEQPARTVESAPGVNVPAAPLAAPAAPSQDPGMAAAKVMAGRTSIAQQRETTTALADRTRAGAGQLSASANKATAQVALAAKAADETNAFGTGGAARSVVAGGCYRIEGAPGASWGSAPLPLLLAMDAQGDQARVLTATGGDTEQRASLRYDGPDSTTFALRRIGYSGSLTLGSIGEVRTGTLRSAQLTGRSEVAVTAPRPTAAPSAVGQPIPVSARRVACPIG